MEGIIIITPNKSNHYGIMVESNLKILGSKLDLFLNEYLHFYNIEELDFNSLDSLNHNYSTEFVSLKKLKETKKKIYRLGIPSQEILSFLKIFLPDEEFVTYKRWGRDKEHFFDEAYMTNDNPRKNKDIRLKVPGREIMIDENSFGETDFLHSEPDNFKIFKIDEYRKRINEYTGGMLNLD